MTGTQLPPTAPRWLQAQRAIAAGGMPPLMMRNIYNHADAVGGEIGDDVGGAVGFAQKGVLMAGSAGEGLVDTMLPLGRAANWLSYGAGELLQGRLPKGSIPEANDWGIPKSLSEALPDKEAMKLESRLSRSPYRKATHLIGSLPPFMGGGAKAGWLGKAFSAPGQTISALGKPGHKVGEWMMRKVGPEATGWAKFGQNFIPEVLGNATGFSLYNLITEEGSYEERAAAAAMGLVAGSYVALGKELGRQAQIGLLKASATPAQRADWAKILDNLEKGKTIDFPLWKQVAPKTLALAIESVGFSAMDPKFLPNLGAGLLGNEQAMTEAMASWFGSFAALVIAKGGNPIDVRMAHPEVAMAAAWNSYLQGEARLRGRARAESDKFDQGRSPDPNAPTGFDQGKRPPESSQPRESEAEFVVKPDIQPQPPAGPEPKPGDVVPYSVFRAFFTSNWHFKDPDGSGTMEFEFPGGASVKAHSDGTLEVSPDVWRAVRGETDIPITRMEGELAADFMERLLALSKIRSAAARAAFGGLETATINGAVFVGDDGRHHTIGIDGEHYSRSAVPEAGEKWKLEKPIKPVEREPDQALQANQQIPAWGELTTALQQMIGEHHGIDQIASALTLAERGDPNDPAVAELLKFLTTPFDPNSQIPNAHLIAPMIGPANIGPLGELFGRLMSGNATAAQAQAELASILGKRVSGQEPGGRPTGDQQQGEGRPGEQPTGGEPPADGEAPAGQPRAPRAPKGGGGAGGAQQGSGGRQGPSSGGRAPGGGEQQPGAQAKPRPSQEVAGSTDWSTQEPATRREGAREYVKSAKAEGRPITAETVASTFGIPRETARDIINEFKEDPRVRNLLRAIGLKVTKKEGQYHVTGKTIANLEDLRLARNKFGGKGFDKPAKAWIYPADPSEFLAERAERRGVTPDGQHGQRYHGGVELPASVANPARKHKGLLTSRAEFTPQPDISVIPKELAQHLRSHQREATAAAWAAMHLDKGGFLLASGPGAGKTRSLLAVAQMYATKENRPVLIVAPNAALGKPAQNEYKVTGEYATAAEAMGIPFTYTRGQKKLEDGQIYLATYTNWKNIDLPKDAVLILDESHQLKNALTTKSQVGLEGLDKIQTAHSVMFVSATPADKLGHFAYLERAGTLEGKTIEEQLEYLGLFATPSLDPSGKIIGQKWGPLPGTPAELITQRIEALFTRLTSRGQMLAHNIPLDAVTVEAVPVELPPEAWEAAQAIASLWGDGMLDNVGGPQQMLQLRLQQEPYKVQKTADLVMESVSKGRLPLIFLSRLNFSRASKKEYDEEGNIISETVATESEGTAKLIKEELVKRGIKEEDIAELHGNSEKSAAESLAMIQDGRAKVMIGTIGSAGMSISLDDPVGNRPRDLYLMTPPWAADEFVQMIGRVNRLNTKSRSNVFAVIADTEIDRVNMDVVMSKLKLLHANVGGELSRLNMQEAVPESSSLRKQILQEREDAAVDLNNAVDRLEKAKESLRLARERPNVPAKELKRLQVAVNKAARSRSAASRRLDKASSKFGRTDPQNIKLAEQMAAINKARAAQPIDAGLFIAKAGGIKTEIVPGHGKQIVGFSNKHNPEWPRIRNAKRAGMLLFHGKGTMTYGRAAQKLHLAGYSIGEPTGDVGTLNEIAVIEHLLDNLTGWKPWGSAVDADALAEQAIKDAIRERDRAEADRAQHYESIIQSFDAGMKERTGATEEVAPVSAEQFESAVEDIKWISAWVTENTPDSLMPWTVEQLSAMSDTPAKAVSLANELVLRNTWRQTERADIAHALQFGTPAEIATLAESIREEQRSEPDDFDVHPDFRGEEGSTIIFNPVEWYKAGKRLIKGSVRFTARYIQNEMWRVAYLNDFYIRNQVESLTKRSGIDRIGADARKIQWLIRHHQGEAQWRLMRARNELVRFRDQLAEVINVNGVPKFRRTAMVEGNVANLTPEGRRMQTAMVASLLYLQHEFFKSGYPIMAPDANGHWIWQTPNYAMVPREPRVWSREGRDHYLGDRTRRIALWQQWVDFNPTLRIGRKWNEKKKAMTRGRPITAEALERIYQEGIRSLDGPDPERRAAFEMARWIKNVPAVGPDGDTYILEPDVFTAFNRIMDLQSSRLAVQAVIGGDYPEVVKRQFGLHLPGPTKYLKDFASELNTGSQEGNQDILKDAQDLFERLQGRDPEHVTREMRRWQENSAIRRAFIAMKSGIYDIPGVPIEAINVGGFIRAMKTLFRADTLWWTQAYKDARDFAERTGALRHEMGHADVGERRSIVTKAAEIASAPSNWLERYKHIQLIMFLQREMLGGWQKRAAKGKAEKEGDVEMIVDLLPHYSEADARLLASGQAGEMLKDQWMLEMIQFMTARGRLSERSRGASSTQKRLQTPFLGYSTKRAAGLQHEFKGAAKAFKLHGQTLGSRARRIKRILSRVGWMAAGSQAATLLAYLLADALRLENGWTRFKRDWAEFPLTMGLRGSASMAIGGPLALLGNAAWEGGAVASEMLLHLNEPLDMAHGAIKTWHNSQWADKDWIEKIVAIPGYFYSLGENTGYVPRDIRIVASATAAGLGFEHDRWASEARILRQWMDKAGIKMAYSTPTREPEFYHALSKVEDRLNSSTGERTFESIWQDTRADIEAALQLQTGETAAAKIRSYRLLGRLSQEQRTSYSRYRGDDSVLKALNRHDRLVSQLAEVVGRMDGTYPMEWAESLDAAKRQADIETPNAWGELASRAAQSVAAALATNQDPITLEVDMLANAMAGRPESVLLDNSFESRELLYAAKLAAPEFKYWLIEQIYRRGEARFKADEKRKLVETQPK